jgi:pimeloyl-ACP methyl ester carboxylesterase
LHGLNDSPAIWYAAGSALGSRFGVSPDYPSLASQQTYETQVNAISGRYSTTGILVGHSNGGIVSRYYGRTQHVRGVVTYGSPNWGAPIVANYGIFSQFMGGTAYEALGVLDLIPYFGDLVPWGTQQDLGWAATVFAGFMNSLLDVTGWIGNPVQDEMSPNSMYVNNVLNGSAGVAAENSNIEVEGSVVFTADRWFGVFHARRGELPLSVW